MTTSDAPQPPGGPLRQDGAEGDVATGAHESGTAGSAGADGSDRERERPGGPDEHSLPDVDGDRPQQDQSDAGQQAENAATSLDQPSS